MSAEATGLIKLIAGSVAGGGVLVLATAAGLGEVQMPEGQTVAQTLSLLSLSAIAYIWSQMNKAKQAEKQRSSKDSDSEDRQNWRELLLQKLEDMAFKTERTTNDTNAELKAHRIEFAAFAGRTEARLDEVDHRIDRMEKRGAA